MSGLSLGFSNPVGTWGVLDMCLCLGGGGVGGEGGDVCMRHGQGFGHGSVSTSPAIMKCSVSHPAGPHSRHSQKNGKSGTHYWGRDVSTHFAPQFVIAVTAPTLVNCIVWVHKESNRPLVSHQLVVSQVNQVPY